MGFRYSYRKMAKLFTNSGDPDQMPHSMASDLGLHCLPVTLLHVSRLHGLKIKYIVECIHLTLKVLITTEADDILIIFIFLRK